MVRFSSPKHIVNSTEDRDRTHHQATVIHRRRRDFLRGWPKDENPHDEQIDAGKGIDQYAEKTLHSPRTPDQFPRAAGQIASFGIYSINFVREHYGAGCSSPEKERTCYEVRRIKGGQGE